MSDKYWLTMIEGPKVGTQYYLEKNEIWIGRDKSVDLNVNNPEVSRKHAKLTFLNGNFVLDDNRSTNGTFVNDIRIVIPTKILNGDIIKFGGQVTFKFDAFTPDAEATVVSYISPENKKFNQPGSLGDAHMPPPILKEPEILQSLVEKKNQPQSRIQKEKLKKYPGWAIILTIIIIFLVVFCLVPILIVEIGDLWCQGFLGDLFQSIAPGSCY